MKVLRPVVFRWLKPVLASKVRLAGYFDTHDWCGDPLQLATVLPGFRVTSLERYLEQRYKKITITQGKKAALDASG